MFVPTASTPMSTAAGVIDLTGLSSSPPSHPDHGDRKPYADRTAKQPKKSAINKDTNAPPEDGEPSRAVKPITTNTQKQRKRKNSQQDSVGTKGENVESNDKRRRREDELDGISQGGAYSPPDVVAGRRSLREKPPGSLFFVDDKPADIRDPYVSASLAGPSNAQQNGGLILPPHVNVADEPSETQEPPPVALSDAEEGEEDFIDYLDVYGERSVCISRRTTATMYADLENERSELFVISTIPAKLIPRLGLSVTTVARKAITKPRIVLIKSFVLPTSFSQQSLVLTGRSV